jgi:hypothetical protein
LFPKNFLHDPGIQGSAENTQVQHAEAVLPVRITVQGGLSDDDRHNPLDFEQSGNKTSQLKSPFTGIFHGLDPSQRFVNLAHPETLGGAPKNYNL